MIFILLYRQYKKCVRYNPLFISLLYSTRVSYIHTSGTGTGTRYYPTNPFLLRIRQAISPKVECER